jgi:hypothetical protein
MLGFVACRVERFFLLARTIHFTFRLDYHHLTSFVRLCRRLNTCVLFFVLYHYIDIVVRRREQEEDPGKPTTQARTQVNTGKPHAPTT